MAPILIDDRGLIKLGLISLVTVLVAFAVGYFSGYQKAAVLYTMPSEVEALALPEPDVLLASDTEPQLPEKIIAGEEIDVDQPVTSVNNAAEPVRGKSGVTKAGITSKSPGRSVVAVIKKPDTKTIDNKTIANVINTDDAAPNNKQPSGSLIKVAKKDTLQNISDADTSGSMMPEKMIPVEIENLTPDEIEKIKYSVQVGMYGNLINAENMANLLQAKNFDAYVADYTNKENKTRYNVRFGYFANKKAAVSALKKYKENQEGDGYLVNFSVESIVNLADKDGVKDKVKPSSPIENIDQTKPSDITATKIDSHEVTSSGITQDEYLSKVQTEAFITN